MHIEGQPHPGGPVKVVKFDGYMTYETTISYEPPGTILGEPEVWTL